MRRGAGEIASWERSRLSQFQRRFVLPVAVAIEVTVVGLFQLGGGGRWLGVSGAIGAAVAMVAGLGAGPTAGAITGLAGALLFASFSEDNMPLAFHGLPVVVAWSMLGLIAGLGALRLRTRAEVERDRLAALQTITERLSDAARPDDVARAVTEVAAPAIGSDLAIVYISDPVRPVLRPAGQAGFTLHQLDEEWAAVPLDAAAPVPDAIRAGSLLALSTAEELLTRYPTPDSRRTLAGLAAAIAVPLATARGATGGLFFGFRQPQMFSSERLALVEAVARQCSGALERAQLFEAEERSALILQRSLLPDRLPDAPWLDVAAHYRPLAGAEVGGDVYDLVELAGDAYLALICDVSGKGTRAAAVTSQVRFTLRALARAGGSPSSLLRELNAVLLTGDLPEGMFCTVALVRFERRAGAARAIAACAGHPAPLLVRAGGGVEELGRPGSLLGALPEVVVVDAAADLAPGDRLLLYTDGITEARIDGELFGERRLVEVLESAAPGSSSELIELVAVAVDEQRDASQDDEALLCVGIRGEA